MVKIAYYQLNLNKNFRYSCMFNNKILDSEQNEECIRFTIMFKIRKVF